MPPSIPKEPPPSPPSPRSLLPTQHHLSPTPVYVAYTSNRKKQKHFFDGLANAAKTWVGYYGSEPTQLSVKLIPFTDVDDIPFPENLNLHAIIHKRTDDMAAAFAYADQPATARLQRLNTLLTTTKAFRSPFHPKLPFSNTHHSPVVAIDPMQGVWRLVDRTQISEAVDRAFSPTRRHPFPSCFHDVRTVPWTQVPVRQGHVAIRAALRKLHFPIILKPRLACGTKASHEMVIADDMEGALAAIISLFAPDLPSPPNPISRMDHDVTNMTNDFVADLIAQEFVTNHGGVLFKVYAIGDNLAVQPRASVSYNKTLRGYHCFDSQRLNRVPQNSFDPLTGCSKATEAVMPSRELAAAIVAELSRELGLSLIGVDLVFNTHMKKYYIVDINYFPGYKGVTNAYEWMLHHICSLVWQRFLGH